jgi:hypothetical protein
MQWQDAAIAKIRRGWFNSFSALDLSSMVDLDTREMNHAFLTNLLVVMVGCGPSRMAFRAATILDVGNDSSSVITKCHR